MPDPKPEDNRSSTDKLIDDVSGSETRNERAYAVAAAGAAAFFTGGNPAATIVASRLGTGVGHGAQEVEKAVHNAFKRWGW